MAKRLTAFSKLLIVLLIIGGLVLGLHQIGALDKIINNDGGDNNISNVDRDRDNSNTNTEPRRTNNNRGGDGDVINVGVVTWGGYAGGQYFNEGFSANTKSRFYKDYGFKVNFKVMDDFIASRKAFENNEVDLLWCTIDAFPTESGVLKGDPKVVFQADWSRGGDAIVVKRGIRNISDLRGKTITYAPMTPSHSYLIKLLDVGGLGMDDFKHFPTASAIDAAAAFKSGKADAAVVWSPDDEDCIRKVPGSKILQNSRSASNIIADGFMAKTSFIENNSERIQQLYEGWMKGAAEINSSERNKAKAVAILAEGLGIPSVDASLAIDNVRLTTHGDNLDFFGLNPAYKGKTAEDIYREMKELYIDVGEKGYPSKDIGSEIVTFTKKAPRWRTVSYRSGIQATKLNGKVHEAESIEFAPVTKDEESKPAIATKRASISFRTGEFQLDDNAKRIIDLEFADIAKTFGGARIRIEGNTDNTGNYANNVTLSKKRAQSVANYLRDTYNMDINRFIVIGNGPDKPVCNQNSDSCRSKNRRTDFELVGA